MRGGAKSERHEAECLIQRARSERERDLAGGVRYELPTLFDLDSIIAIIGLVQLSLRHPGNKGQVAKIGRDFVASAIARLKQDGYPAHAEIAEAGNDPRFDS